MAETSTIRGTYGSGRTTCDVFIYVERGGRWYAVDGSTVANFTHDDIPEGTNVETLNDSDTLTWNEPIRSEEDLEAAVEDGAEIPDSDEDEETQEDEHAELIDSFDESEYDTEAMRTDAANGNFSPDRAEEYRHTAIVAADIVNGQFSQAREHCARFGLNYEEQMVANGRNPWK